MASVSLWLNCHSSLSLIKVDISNHVARLKSNVDIVMDRLILIRLTKLRPNRIAIRIDVVRETIRSVLSMLYSPIKSIHTEGIALLSRNESPYRNPESFPL